MPRPRQPRNTTRARNLRQQMSLPETVLWNLLRKAPDGVVFRRQHPIGPFVIDFYCARAKLCIEIDGLAHDMGDRPERDEVRNHWLRERRFEVLRIPATDVFKSPQDVAEALVRYCRRD